MNFLRYCCLRSLPWLFAALLSACASVPAAVEMGVQLQHRSFVPARIAILPCQVWPQSAAYEQMKLTDAKDFAAAGICQRADAFVLDGFAGQPYMSGYSPKSVAQLLENKGKKEYLGSMFASWQHMGGDCDRCTDGPTFYRESISQRADWRLWLNTLSKAVASADAVLLPIVDFVYQQKYDDRGVMAWKKAAKLTLYLLDTNSGAIIWQRSRDGVEINLEDRGSPAKNLDEPHWEKVLDRIFVAELWREFPGRR